MRCCVNKSNTFFKLINNEVNDMYKTNELIAIEIISSAYKQFFEEENKKLKLDPNLIKFFTRYLVLKESINIDILEQINRDASAIFSQRIDLHIAAFFGIDNVCESTHQYLKNPRAFFSLYSMFIEKDEFPSCNLKKIEDAVSIHERMNISYDARVYSAIIPEVVISSYIVFRNSYLSYLEDKNEEFLNLNHLSKHFLKLNLNTMQSYVNKFLHISRETIRKYTESNKIVVYRGFEICEQDSVRVNRYKVSNELSKIQDAGKSVCYTLDKKIAYYFATHKFKKHVEFNFSYEDRFNRARLLLNKLNIDSTKFTSRKNRRVYVAKYEVDTKDILFDKSHDYEREVLVLPKNARLVEYRPVKYS